MPFTKFIQNVSIHPENSHTATQHYFYFLFTSNVNFGCSFSFLSLNWIVYLVMQANTGNHIIVKFVVFQFNGTKCFGAPI